MNNKKCCHCSQIVNSARIEAGYNYCIMCADSIPKVRGVMCYGGKTAGEMQVVTPEHFADHRKYNPYGRNTGRGSGVHKVMNSSNV